MKPGDTLTIDDALNAIRDSINLLEFAKRISPSEEKDKLIQSTYTLLSLAYPALEEKRP